MKKIFYLIICLLVMPMFVFAKEIEVKGINAKETYNDINLSVSASGEVSLEFAPEERNFTPKAVYTVKLDNTTNENYKLNFKGLDSLNQMTITTNKTVLAPGENDIEITIERPKLSLPFYDTEEKTIQIELTKESEVIKETDPTTNTTPEENKKNEKKNPETGETIVTVAIISIAFISLAVAMYAKTKNSSSFFILLALLAVPGIISAKESNTITIKLKTNVDKYSVCFYGDPIEEYINGYNNTDYEFEQSELILNTKKDKLLQNFLENTEEVNKDNILSILSSEDTIAMFEMKKLEEHFTYYDDKTDELLPVEGEDNIGNDYLDAVRDGRPVIVYDDGEDELTLLLKLPEPFIISRNGYEVSAAKVVFNKHNNDYLMYFNNNYYSEFGYIVVMNYASYGYYNMKERMIPVMNIKNHINKILGESSSLVVDVQDDVYTYILDNNAYTENALKDHTFASRYYTSDVENHLYIYDTNMLFLRDERFVRKYLFIVANNETYTLNTNMVYQIERGDMSVHRHLVNPNFAQEYLVVLNPSYACYSFTIVD